MVQVFRMKDNALKVAGDYTGLRIPKATMYFVVV